jgi:CheY-like chemotaxis protein
VASRDLEYRHQLRNVLLRDSIPVSVHEADGTRDAIETLQRRPVDLVVMDLLLSDADAFEILRGLQTSARALHLHVLVTVPDDLDAEEKDYLTSRLASLVTSEAATVEAVAGAVARMLEPEVETALMLPTVSETP